MRILALILLMLTALMPVLGAPASDIVDEEPEAGYSHAAIQGRLARIKGMRGGDAKAYRCADLLNDFAIHLIENGQWCLSAHLVEATMSFCPKDK